jgi:amino acid transporter
MARDGAVPFARWLGTVHPEQRTPHRAAVVVGLLGIGPLVLNLNSETLMIALVCVSIVWANLAYLLTTAPLLVARLRGPADGDSLLGRWGLPINSLAVGWGVFLIVNIGWPRARFYGDEWYERYGAPLYTAVVLAVGLVVFAVIRPGRRAGEAA